MSAVPHASPDDDILRLHVTSEDPEALRALLRENRPDVGGRPHVEADGRIGIDVYTTADRIPDLEREGVTVTRTGNASEAGRAAQAEVGSGDRFTPDDAVPHGLATKLAG
ncbi:hypothetical protein ACFV0O_22140 [Kitasatospora sp. NPDC059577]|uniref:hypothetical protein n=1 Tax=Kitasatospora sp. NPDC059577 TaxID=3346873 RepID=UPI00367EAF99